MVKGLLIIQNTRGGNDRLGLINKGNYSHPVDPFLSLPCSLAAAAGLPAKGTPPSQHAHLPDSLSHPIPAPHFADGSSRPCVVPVPDSHIHPSAHRIVPGCLGRPRGWGAAQRSPKELQIAHDVYFTSCKTFCGGFIYANAV